MVNHGYAKFIYKHSDGHSSGQPSDLQLLYGSKSPSMSQPLKSPELNTVRLSHSLNSSVTVASPVCSNLLPPTASSTILNQQSSSSSSSSSTMPTVEAQNDGAACEYRPGENFQGDIEVNNKLPSKSTLDKAADLPVLDKDGKSVPFKSLYWSEASQGKRVMVLFIRHFFCGVSLPRWRLDAFLSTRLLTHIDKELPRVPSHLGNVDTPIIPAVRHDHPGNRLWIP